MEFHHILVELKDRILYITINRAHKLNALNKETLVELSQAVAEASANDEVSGIILTGAGEKAFVAGADISEFSDYNSEQGEDLARTGQKTVFDAIENCPKPVIAAINGYALGGGLELALACHLRIASDQAKLGFPEVTLGLIPGYGGTQRLTKLIGKGRALEMIITAEAVSAAQAEKIGLINYMVSPEELIKKAVEILEKVKQRAPLAVAGAIKAVNSSLLYNENGFETEIEQFGKCFNTSDFKEGTSAFLEKRKPIFSGK